MLNYSGIDLSPAQWQTLVPIFLARKHVAFFDMAYQALSSGNMHDDAFGLRLFANNNEIPILLAHSFSQNFGLYGERIGFYYKIKILIKFIYSIITLSINTFFFLFQDV